MDIHSDSAQYENYRRHGAGDDKKFYAVSMAAGFLIAVAVMAVAVKKESALALVFGEEYFENYRLVSVNKLEFWGYVVLNRAKWLLIWIFIGLNPYHKKIYLCATGFVGAIIGVTASAIVMNFGIEGIGLLFWLIFPHGVFYYFSGMLVIKRADCSGMIWQKTVIVLLLILLSMLIGCALESFLNPFIIQKMIK